MNLQNSPDWIEIYTKEDMEKELQGFKFKGSGLYLSNMDTIVILPEEEWIINKIKHSRYELWYYNATLENTMWSILDKFKIVSDERS